MEFSRREFVKVSAMAGAGLLVAGRGRAYGYSISIGLKKFEVPLPAFGGTGPLGFGRHIPLAQTAGTPYVGVDYYEVTAGVYRQQLHPGLPNPTRLYGYSTSGVDSQGNLVGTHLGAAILATKGKPVRIRLKNALPATHMLPFDSSIPSPGNGGSRQDRAAVHLHGGLVPWPSDGGPFHWTAAGTDTSYESLTSASAVVGSSVTGWLPDVNGRPTFDYYYPNNQSARLMWYHDHAVGITRLNAYAGLATGYLVMDPDDLMPFGDVLVFQDKVFWDPAADPDYPKHVTDAVPGDLWYPYLYEKQLWKLSGRNNAKKGALLPVNSSVAEFFGDTMLVNGVVYPYHVVNQGKNRFRLLNACNGRFLNLSFMYEDPNTPGEPLLDKTNGLPVLAPVGVVQIGNECGYLPSPVTLFPNGANGTPPCAFPLLLGPAERADLIVDFSACECKNVLLYNDAPAPFPGGNSTFDYHLGVKGVVPGYGPNTRTLMQFRLDPSAPADDIELDELGAAVLPTVPDPVSGGLKVDQAAVGAAFPQYTYIPPESGLTKEVTLNEAFDPFGRLTQLVGTNIPLANGGFGRAYLDAPTEATKIGTIEIWNVYNLTADAHPMHFHLFNVMVLCRRPFRVNQFSGSPIWTASGRGPEPTECGWKETVKMFPGECTTVAVLVEDPMPVGGAIGRDPSSGRPTVTVTDSRNNNYVGALPFSPRLKAFGIDGDEYVWHCHILEHEEHDMMRPLVSRY